MRRMVIEQKVSGNHKRKNLSMVEIIDQDGFVARAEKKYSYYVSECNNMPDPASLKNWTDAQMVFPERKDRHVSIQRVYDKEKHVAQLIYRVVGSFYVVQNLHIFAVVFMHSIRFHVWKGNSLAGPFEFFK